MISSATVGFIVFFMLIALLLVSFGAAWVVTHHPNAFGRWAGFGLGIIAMMLAIPIVIMVGRVAVSIN